MNDACGKELLIGQYVVTTDRHYKCQLMICKVVGFTPKKVKVEIVKPVANWSHVGDAILKDPEVLAIVDYSASN